MKIDLHGLNDRDRWPLSSGCVTDACAIFLSERKKWIKLVQKKKTSFEINRSMENCPCFEYHRSFLSFEKYIMDRINYCIYRHQ